MAKEKVTQEQIEKEADRYAGNVSAENLDETIKREENFKDLFKTVKKLNKYLDDIITVFSLLKDYYVTKEYKECPWRTIAALVGMLIYVMSPFDLIPDFMPVIGWSDDLAMVAFVLEFAKDDLKAYREWKAKTKAAICA